MSFGKNLRKYRKEKGLTRKYIATTMGVSVTSYGFYEQERNLPTFENILKLSQILDVSIDTLMDNATNERKHNRCLIDYLAGKLAEIASVTADKPVTTADIIELAERNVHK